MKVGIKDAVDKSVVVGEMNIALEGGIFGEMITDPTKLSDIGFGSETVARAARLKEINGDAAEFPVIRTEEGWSNSNRLWDGATLESIAEQTNKMQPVGHLGHIPDDLVATSMPEPQTTWIGAFTRKEKSEQDDHVGEMVTVLYTAGSNIPGAKVQMLLKNFAVRGTSWWGRARNVPVPGKGVRIEGFKLLAIDWARKGSEGMPTARVVAMAREMSTGGDMDKELSQVTPDEFRKENPNGYSLLVAEMTKEKDGEIAALQTKVDEAVEEESMIVKLCETLGITDPKGLITKVTELKNAIGAKSKKTLDDALDKLLAEKVSDSDSRKIVRGLLEPVTGEMEAKVAALDSNDVEAVEKLVGEMLDAEFNSRETIKLLVSETGAPLVRKREEINRNLGASARAVENSGMKRERVTL